MTPANWLSVFTRMREVQQAGDIDRLCTDLSGLLVPLRCMTTKSDLSL